MYARPGSWFSLALIGFALLRSPASAADYRVYVSNERSGDVTVIDGASRRVVATWAVGKRPRGIHLSPDGSRLYVAVSGSPIMAPGAHEDRAKERAPDKAADGIVIVDTTSGRVLRKLQVGSDPEQFAVTPDGRRIIVSNEDEESASCWEVEGGAKVYATGVSPEPEGVALPPSRPEVYVTCEQRGDVFVLNRESGAVIARFQVRGRPRSVTFLPDGSKAYVPAEGESAVSVVDATAHTVQATIKIPGADMLPMCAITAPDGSRVFVSTGRGNAIAAIDPATNRVAAMIQVGSRPWGIALSPDGRMLYAANGRSDDVSVVDVDAGRAVTRIKAGKGPWGVAISAPHP